MQSEFVLYGLIKTASIIIGLLAKRSVYVLNARILIYLYRISKQFAWNPVAS